MRANTGRSYIKMGELLQANHSRIACRQNTLDTGSSQPLWLFAPLDETPLKCPSKVRSDCTRNLTSFRCPPFCDSGGLLRYHDVSFSIRERVSRDNYGAASYRRGDQYSYGSGCRRYENSQRGCPGW